MVPEVPSVIPAKYIVPVAQVEKRLEAVKTNKAIGPDGIPNWLLHEMAPVLAGPVCALINSSFRDGYLAYLWKTAHVCPISKVTRPRRLDKYFRPITLTPVMSS